MGLWEALVGALVPTHFAPENVAISILYHHLQQTIHVCRGNPTCCEHFSTPPHIGADSTAPKSLLLFRNWKNDQADLISRQIDGIVGSEFDFHPSQEVQTLLQDVALILKNL